MNKVREFILPYILFGVGLGYLVTSLFFYESEDRNLILIILTVFPTSIVVYIRRFSEYGLYFSENVISFKIQGRQITIPWKSLSVEILDDSSLFFPQKKIFFRDTSKISNDFEYKINLNTRSSFIELTNRYAPKDHLLVKIVKEIKN